MAHMKTPVRILLTLLCAAACSRASDTALLLAESRKLVASKADNANVLGFSVSIQGDVAAVGAPGAYDGYGALLIFQRDAGGSNRWGLVRKWEMDFVLGDTPKGFGYSVSVWSNRIAVGSPDIDASPSGSAYFPSASAGGVVVILQRDQGGSNNWGGVATFSSPDSHVGDGFGTAVSLQSNRLAVGESFAGGLIVSEPTGRVHLIEFNGASWTNRRRVVAADAGANQSFGTCVSLSGDRVAVGAPGKTNFGARTGAAYVFERTLGGADNWGQERKILAADAQSNAAFGTSVALDGTNLAVGATYLNTGLPRSGAAYLFGRDVGGTTNWGQVKKLAPPVPQLYGLFGFSVALQGTNLAVGAPGLGYLSPIIFTNGIAPGAADGSVFLFGRDAGGAGAWGLTRQIKRVEDDDGNGFGFSISLDRDDLIASAPYDDEAGIATGRAFLHGRDVGGADGWGLRRILDFEDRFADDRFGTEVAVHQDTAVVTAPRRDRPSYMFGQGWTNAGSVFCYERMLGGSNAWGLAQLLDPRSEFRDGDEWGSAVAVWSNTLVVGCPGYDGTNGVRYNMGTVTVYERAAADQLWTFKQFLHPADGTNNDNFGAAVAVNNGLIIVGAPGHDAAATDAGAFYAYTRPGTNWAFLTKLLPTDPRPGAHYGGALAMGDDWIVVGAAGDNERATAAGAAYLVDRFSGVQRKLAPADLGTNHLFGSAVAVYGDHALVGAWGAGVPALYSGAAYLFQKNYGGPTNWGQIRKLSPPATNAALGFGYAVALDSVNAVIGAIGDTNNGGLNAGALYNYSRDQGGPTNWGLVERLTASDAATNLLFGNSVALFNTTLIGGAIGESSYGLTNAGAAYIFDDLRCAIRDQRRSGANLALDLTVSPGRTYRVQQSTNMMDWVPALPATYTADELFTTYTLTNAFTATNCAFRLRYVPPPALP